jgi:serine/threonine protein kinase
MLNNEVTSVAIADYDTVCQSERTNKRGTRGYVSPETLVSNAYSSEADIWSLGIVALELMLCEKQQVDIGYEMSTIESQYDVHCTLEEQLEARDAYSNRLVAKVLQMLKFSPTERGDAHSIYTWCCDQLGTKEDSPNNIDDNIYVWCKNGEIKETDGTSECDTKSDIIRITAAEVNSIVRVLNNEVPTTETKTERIIDITKLEFATMLSEGAFGTIYSGTLEGKPVAIKVCIHDSTNCLD